MNRDDPNALVRTSSCCKSLFTPTICKSPDLTSSRRTCRRIRYASSVRNSEDVQPKLSTPSFSKCIRIVRLLLLGWRKDNTAPMCKPSFPPFPIAPYSASPVDSVVQRCGANRSSYRSLADHYSNKCMYNWHFRVSFLQQKQYNSW